MTIESQYTPQIYTAQGPGPYQFNFEVFDGTIVVTVDEATVSGFTVEYFGEGPIFSGGTVTFTTAPPNGSEIKIARLTPVTQSLDYQAYDRFPAESTETNFDKLVMIIQEGVLGESGGSGAFLPLAGGDMSPGAQIGWQTAQGDNAQVTFGRVFGVPAFGWGPRIGTDAVGYAWIASSTANMAYDVNGVLALTGRPALSELPSNAVALVGDLSGGGGGDFLPLAGGQMDENAFIDWETTGGKFGRQTFGTLLTVPAWLWGPKTPADEPCGYVWSVSATISLAYDVNGVLAMTGRPALESLPDTAVVLKQDLSTAGVVITTYTSDATSDLQATIGAAWNDYGTRNGVTRTDNESLRFVWPSTGGNIYEYTGSANGPTWTTVDTDWFLITAAVTWGSISGTLSDQADLQAALDARLSLSGGTFDSAAIMNFSAQGGVNPAQFSYESFLGTPSFYWRPAATGGSTASYVWATNVIAGNPAMSGDSTLGFTIENQVYTEPDAIVCKDYFEANTLPDAPSDGSTYGRNNGAWVIISGGGVVNWGDINGVISDQADLTAELLSKLSLGGGTMNPDVGVNWQSGGTVARQSVESFLGTIAWWIRPTAGTLGFVWSTSTAVAQPVMTGSQVDGFSISAQKFTSNDAILTQGRGNALYQPIGNYLTESAGDLRYAALVHTHVISDVIGLQSALDAKQDDIDGWKIPIASGRIVTNTSTAPTNVGTARGYTVQAFGGTGQGQITLSTPATSTNNITVTFMQSIGIAGLDVAYEAVTTSIIRFTVLASTTGAVVNGEFSFTVSDRGLS